MSNVPNSNAAKLKDYLNDSRILSAADFERHHGQFFFVHHGPIGKLKKPLDNASTANMESNTTTPDRPMNPQADFLVFPVRSQSDDLIWVGRSADNDISIPDGTVSEVHAFIKVVDGAFFLQDTGSRNGTTVNGERVPPQGIGPPVVMKSGCRVQFGSVRMTALGTKQFRALVNQLLG